MKIVILAPHPDDEVFGCGGSILKWLDEGHDVHIIYVTDNRALISWGQKSGELIEEEAKQFLNLNEDEIAEIGLKEAEDVAEAFGFVKSKVNLLKFHDLDAINQIEIGTSLSKEIMKDTQRIVIPPSDKDGHPDHHATHLIAKRVATELGLTNVEFYIYYMNPMNAPKEKRAKIRMAEYREKLYEIMSLYKTQLCLKAANFGWPTLKQRRTEYFGVFKYEDMEKYSDF